MFSIDRIIDRSVVGDGRGVGHVSLFTKSLSASPISAGESS
jgi:hypothetical protein